MHRSTNTRCYIARHQPIGALPTRIVRESVRRGWGDAYRCNRRCVCPCRRHMMCLYCRRITECHNVIHHVVRGLRRSIVLVVPTHKHGVTDTMQHHITMHPIDGSHCQRPCVAALSLHHISCVGWTEHVQHHHTSEWFVLVVRAQLVVGGSG